MNLLRRMIRRFHNDERGSITPALVVLVPAMVLVIGLVVDGGGKVQENNRAQAIASGASRAAANSLGSQVISNGTLTLNTFGARRTAEDYIAAAGMSGNVDVVGDRIIVTVKTDYETKIVSVLGFATIPVQATATAQIITQ